MTMERLSLNSTKEDTVPVHVDRDKVWILGLLVSIPLIALGAYLGGRA
jgi:hypothetical protein